MIRLSNSNDIDGIVTLWNEAFGDSEQDILFFLNAHYKSENTVVFDDDGIIASVLFLLDGDMHIKGVDYPSYYLYAACTLKNYRGRGIMAALLEYAKTTAAHRNKYFIALKPAEDTLYNYYSKFGYESVFTKKIAVFDTERMSYKDSFYSETGEAALSEIRDNVYADTDYFKWDKHSVEFAVKHHKYFGGESLECCNGYMLYSENDSVLHVKESTFTDSQFTFFTQETAKKHKADIIRAELPSGFEIDCRETHIVRSGMLQPLCDEASILIKNIKNAYLALTLD